MNKRGHVMQKLFLATVAALAAVSAVTGARASTFAFIFTGPGVSGSIDLTYGMATDSRYTDAFVATQTSGTFSDSNVGIFNAPIGMLEPRTFSSPEPGTFWRRTASAGSRWPRACRPATTAS